MNASGAYVHLSNHIEVKEPLRQFTDPAKDFVHSIVPDDKFISSILDNIGAHTLTFPLLERNLTTIDANVMWPLFTGGKRIFASRIGNRMVDWPKQVGKRRELLCNRSWWKLIMLCVWRKEWWMYASKPFLGLQKHYRNAMKLEENGMINKAERLFAQVTMDEARRELESARKDLNVAQNA